MVRETHPSPILRDPRNEVPQANEQIFDELCWPHEPALLCLQSTNAQCDVYGTYNDHVLDFLIWKSGPCC